MVLYQNYHIILALKLKLTKCPTGRTKSSKTLIIMLYGYHLWFKLSSNLFDFVLK